MASIFLPLALSTFFIYLPCKGDLGSIDTAVNSNLLSKFKYGYQSLLLGEHFDLNITIMFTSNITLNCMVLVNFDHKFEILNDSNNKVTITHGDGVAAYKELIQTNGSYLKIDFGDIITNSSADDSSITYVTVPMSLSKPGSFFDLLNISSSVSSGNFNARNVLTSKNNLYFLGPEVNSDVNWNSGDNIIVLHSYTEVTISLLIAANSEIKDLEVGQDFFSSKLSLTVIYTQCLAIPTTGNITFSSASNTNITHFNSTMVSSSGHIVRPKRQASSLSFSSFLRWIIGDVSNNGDAVAVLNVKMFFSFDGMADEFTPSDSIKHSLFLNLNGGSAQLLSSDLGIAIPKLTVTKSVKMDGVVDVNGDIIQVLCFTTVVSHDVLSSNSEAFEVSIVDYVEGFVVDYFDEFVPVFGTVGLTVTESSLSYTSSSLKVGENITLSYKAYFNEDTLSRDGENLYLPVTVEWKTLSKAGTKPVFSGTQHGPIQYSICVQMNANYDSSELATKHGLAALAFFICVLVAVIVVVIVAIVCIQFYHRGPYSIVQPVDRGQKRGLLLDSNLAGKTCTYEESSLVSVNESIVMILILEQSSKKYREFDNLDILNTITLDVELEEQRVEAMAKLFELIIQKWTLKKQLTKEVDSKVKKEFQRRLKDLTKKMNGELRRDSLMLRKQLTATNNLKLIQLQKKQRKEYQNATDEAHGQSEIMQLLHQQHQVETAKLLFMLKLQQDENQEILRKEYAIRKRIGIRSIQQECLNEVIVQENLKEEQAREIMADHLQNMAILEKRMDEEISKQRMFLEEQLERHRALVARNVSQEEHHKRILNMMVKETVEVLYQLHDDDQLNEEQVRQYVDKFQNEVVVAKDKYEEEKKRQEKYLHMRMSALKKQKLREKVKDNNSELEEFENEQKKKQANSKFEASEYLDFKLTLLSEHTLKLKDTENELNEEAAKKLEELREKLRENMEETIEKTKNHLYSNLKSKGLTNKMKDEIMEEHHQNRQLLREEWDKQKSKQEEEIKKHLAEKRKIREKRKADERDEQRQIREHESKMVGKLLATQLVMSEIERDKIMQEHGKLMVTLENNITLNKLHQRRKLEEKIEVRRARQMEKLERQQQQEKRRLLRSKHIGSENEDDRDESEMMKKHAEQRLALLSSEKPLADDDHDNIRVEMLHERVQELKKQEEKVGFMIAELQMEKAREMATIEEQQKSLMQLKMSILDDMTERHIIQNSQSKKIIESHRKEICQLERKLNDAREKHEKELKKKLKEKQVEREKTFIREQEISLLRFVEKEANSTKAKLRKVAVKHKQTIELENFRQTFQVEIRQSLEDLRRSFQIKRLKAIQDQELRLLGNLIRYGKYGYVELTNSLKLLFPMKTEKELKQMLSEMHDNTDTGNEESESDNANGIDRKKLKKGKKERKQKSKKLKETKKVTLERKVRSAILMASSLYFEDSIEPSSRIVVKTKLAPINRRYDEKSLEKSLLPIHGVRPEPVGCADSIDYVTDKSITDSQDEEEIKRQEIKTNKWKDFRK